MTAWNNFTIKQVKKGTLRKPKPSSEKAWVDRSYADKQFQFKKSYIEFVRYMRWYCHRSYLQRKIYMGREYDPNYFYPEYPRFVA